MTGLLDRALEDLATNPDSTAREIARRLDVRDDRLVFAVLDRAAYDGRVQRWRDAGATVWRWQIPPAAT